MSAAGCHGKGIATTGERVQTPAAFGKVLAVLDRWRWFLEAVLIGIR